MDGLGRTHRECLVDTRVGFAVPKWDIHPDESVREGRSSGKLRRLSACTGTGRGPGPVGERFVDTHGVLRLQKARRRTPR